MRLSLVQQSISVVLYLDSILEAPGWCRGWFNFLVAAVRIWSQQQFMPPNDPTHINAASYTTQCQTVGPVMFVESKLEGTWTLCAIWHVHSVHSVFRGDFCQTLCNSSPYFSLSFHWTLHYVRLRFLWGWSNNRHRQRRSRDQDRINIRQLMHFNERPVRYIPGQDGPPPPLKVRSGPHISRADIFTVHTG